MHTSIRVKILDNGESRTLVRGAPWVDGAEAFSILSLYVSSATEDIAEGVMLVLERDMYREPLREVFIPMWRVLQVDYYMVSS